MSGAKAVKPQSIDQGTLPEHAPGKGKPAEPSMDQILASIRKIIADQNEEADRAAAKAAADVANPQPDTPKVDSIIGSVAADHWKADPDRAVASPDHVIAEPSILDETVPHSGELPSKMLDDDTAHLEELISQIAAVPPAPLPVAKRWKQPDRKVEATPNTTEPQVMAPTEQKPVEGEPVVQLPPVAEPQLLQQAQSANPVQQRPVIRNVEARIIEPANTANRPIVAKPVVRSQTPGTAVAPSAQAVDSPAKPVISGLSAATVSARPNDLRSSPPLSTPQVSKNQTTRPAAPMQASAKPVARPVQQPAPAKGASVKPAARSAPGSALDRLLANKAGQPASSAPAGTPNAGAPSAAKPGNTRPKLTPVQEALRKHVQSPSANRPDAGRDVHRDIMRLREGQIAPQPSSQREPNATRSAAIAPTSTGSGNVQASANAAFERLARSMLHDRKDDVDDMMAEIMRPMMREWLEDNLPSLVERIVREEIERVSRGTHR